MLTKLKDYLYKHQRILGMGIIFLFLSLISFSFDNHEARLLWNIYPQVGVLLVLVIALAAYIWLRIEKYKTRLLIEKLKGEGAKNPKQHLLAELSTRQLEVFELIQAGKSNKEIMAELNIEQSTLKTHINQIYKILGIKHRKEVKTIATH